MKIPSIILTLALLLAGPLTGWSQNYSSYYTDLPVAVKPVSPISFPERTASITGHGAVGDGVTLCTAAIQQTIDSLAALGGGYVRIPAGVWLTGPIELKDNINLQLDKNAILYFSPDKELYIDPSPKASRVKACISAMRCSNIGISGSGIIDGNGAQWRPVKRGKVSDTEWKNFKKMGGTERQGGSLWYPWEMKSGYPDIASTPEKQEKMRNDLFRVNHCENILLTGATFQNAPKFHVHPFNSRNIIIDGITVRCPWNAQNGDAIDLSDCHQALVVNSTVDAGDDGICLKSGDAKKGTDINGVKDILIQDNTVYHAHGGFVIGSEDICGMERVVVRGCRFSGTDTGLRFKSAIGRGGKTSDIYISGIVMADIVNEAVIFECTYADRPAGSKDSDVSTPLKIEKVPEFKDIHISDIICRGCSTGIAASGIEGLDCVHDIYISDSTISYTSKATDIDSATADISLKDVRLVRIRK
ncbi:MAG: glycoside hydrolase family 28 protein [Muribaculaceae bacterium]|nr:glycoside hydrolase family 28 protein [Muribaculaceae bacterium]